MLLVITLILGMIVIAISWGWVADSVGGSCRRIKISPGQLAFMFFVGGILGGISIKMDDNIFMGGIFFLACQAASFVIGIKPQAKILGKISAVSSVVLVGAILYLVFTVKMFEGTSTAQYATYNDYVNSERMVTIPLPVSAQQIERFHYGGFDSNYEFIQAKVEKDKLHLKETVFGCEMYGVSEATFIENAAYSTAAFNKVFQIEKPPDWWWQNDSMDGFYDNALRFGNDEKYGTDEGYGQGCWAFYNEQTQTLRVFRWIQQWLSNKWFQEAFGLTIATQ